MGLKHTERGVKTELMDSRKNETQCGGSIARNTRRGKSRQNGLEHESRVMRGELLVIRLASSQ